MRLYYSNPSAFSRKVRLAAAALGISDQIELIVTNPVKDRAALQGFNPLGKIPVLVVDGMPIFDSGVICGYLDERFGPGKVIPGDRDIQMQASRLEALGDGIIEAGMLLRAELMRQEAARDAGVVANQSGKVTTGLDWIEANAAEVLTGWTVGQMAVASAVGWLQFRLEDMGVLTDRPALREWYERTLQRSDMQATRPDA